MLASTLNQHPEIQIDLEFLYPDPTVDVNTFYAFWADSISENKKLLSPNWSPRVAFNYITQMRDKAKKPIFGLDLKLEQLDQVPWAEPAFYNRSYKFIILKRANLLKQTLSEFIMLQRLKEGDKDVHRETVPDSIRISVDPESILERMRYRYALINKYARKVESYGIPSIVVIYEELCGPSRKSIISDILSFLEVDDVDVDISSKLVKQNSDSIEDIVNNYDDIRSRILRSEFEYTLVI